MQKIKRLFSALTLCLLLIAGAAPVAQAACSPDLQSCSSGYGVNEVFFGSGGQLNACSSNYCAKQSAGETGVGNTKSTNYQAQAGFNTDRVPSLTFIVNAANINLGVLTPGTTATANATFSVKSYLSSGYTVQARGAPPTNGSHQLAPITTTGVQSNPVQEQFGMNLVANTTACGAPANFGAGPSQAPNSTFGFGAATVPYGSCGYFIYNDGDQIAYSTSSSGETDYTVSYIFNTTPLTPGGTYTMNQVFVATATF